MSNESQPYFKLIGLKGTKMAAVFVGVGIAVGIAVSFAIISGQNRGNVLARVVDDGENPFLDPEFLKTYQTNLRTGAHHKSEVVVGQEAFFVSDAVGKKAGRTDMTVNVRES